MSVMNDTDLETIIAQYAGTPGGLLPALHAVQHAIGHIPASASEPLAKAFRVSVADVDGTISFYSHFRREPAGRHIVEVCRAEACQAMGGGQLEAHARQSLGVDWGGTTADGNITLEPVYCLGNCACTPSVAVDGKVYARVDNARFDAIVDGLRSGGAN